MYQELIHFVRAGRCSLGMQVTVFRCAFLQFKNGKRCLVVIHRQNVVSSAFQNGFFARRRKNEETIRDQTFNKVILETSMETRDEWLTMED